jgi:hypothetical protein
MKKDDIVVDLKIKLLIIKVPIENKPVLPPSVLPSEAAGYR